MIALEFKELVEVTTSKGDGYIWYMMDYGPHSDTLYTIIIKQSGECWQMCHIDFRSNRIQLWGSLVITRMLTFGILKNCQRIGLPNK